MVFGKEKTKNLGEKPLLFHMVYYESHLIHPGLK
jgi:hypothetical protein